MKKIIAAIGVCLVLSLNANAQISNGAGGNVIVPNSSNSNNNVGIGNNNPVTPLHLGTETKSGNIFIDGNFKLPTDPDRIPSTLYLNSPGFGITAKSFGQHDNDLFLFTPIPDYAFSPPGRQETHDIRFGTKVPNFQSGGTSWTDRTSMIIKESGDVAIGRDFINPWAQFQVMGYRTNDFAVFSNSHNRVVPEAALIFGSYSESQKEQNNPRLLQLYGNTDKGFGVTDAWDRFQVFNNGQVVVGNVPIIEGYKLFVEEGIITERLKVAVASTADWRDCVFESEYDLMSLSNIESYVKANKHLPGVPSAEEVVKNGIDVAKMDAMLLGKIEELTLHMIQMQKDNKNLQLENKNLELRLLEIESLKK